jgi:hypothetical protein
MKCELHFSFSLSCENWRGKTVSDDSKRIAGLFQHHTTQKVIKDATDLEHKRFQAEGLRRMRSELEAAAKVLCEDLNHEPQVGNILSCKSEDEEFKITRSDTGAVLSVKYDEFLYKATAKCDTPAKFKYVIQVKTSGNGWWYADKDDTAIAESSIPWIANIAVSALLGIPR